jgi:hypothetical protein
MVAADGLAFSQHWTVAKGAPKPKWYGYPGFQYPSFMWCRDCGAEVQDAILFVYSISKEDIQIAVAPLASIGERLS